VGYISMTMPDWSQWDSQKTTIIAEYKARIDFFEWRDLGIANKWISEPFCDTHDSGYMTDEEEVAWENGEDPCMSVFRIWEDNIELPKDQKSLFDQ
jgi:hypothetical protein